MSMTTPIVVEWHEETDRWVVRVGKGGRRKAFERVKTRATQTAMWYAEGGKHQHPMDQRPGVVVMKKNGEYHRFLENPQYFKQVYED